MKHLLFLFLAFALGESAIVRSNIRRIPSLRTTLIRQGKWAQFVASHNVTLSRKAKTSKANSSPETISEWYNDFYVGIVEIGTPPQALSLTLDTGSATLWVIDSTCTSQACRGDDGEPKTRFDTSKSSTFVSANSSFNLYYGLGDCHCNAAYDAVNIAGLVAPQQGFGVADSIADVFAGQPMDGILGLAWPSLAANNITPPMQNLLSQMDQPLFTVYLARLDDGLANATGGGQITYGGLDDDHCNSDVHYVSLTSKSYWQFTLDSFYIGTFIIAQPYQYTLPCSGSYPEMKLTIGGQIYTIASHNYVLDLALGDGYCVLTVFITDDDLWILGDTFIRSYCNVYDIGNGRIGFASHKAAFSSTSMVALMATVLAALRLL